MIVRCVAVLVMLGLGLASGQTNIDDLNSIFDTISPESDSIQSTNCQEIEGKVKGCQECYPCNHSIIAHHRASGNPIQTLTLNSKKCVPVEVCCINQLLIGTRFGSPCGVPCGTRNPEGAGARQSRAGVRAVLEGEYPWAGYIYKKVGSSWRLACGATYIQEKFNAFLTSAACVQGLSAASLAVTFYQEAPSAANVARIIVHEAYDAGSGNNNIAILTLKGDDDLPSWSLPACLPDQAAKHATSCVTLEEHNNIINVVIPKKRVCEGSHASRTCAVAPPDDFRPAHGAGLYCETQCEKSLVYLLHGVASSHTADDITTYTNVFHLHPWISHQLR